MKKFTLLFSFLLFLISGLSAQTTLDTIPLGCFMPLSVSDRGYLGYTDQLALWKSQVIPYEFANDFQALYGPNVLQAFQTIQEHTNLCFVPRRDETTAIRIRPFNNTAYSFADLQDETINLSDFSQTTIIHEIGHLLGLCHEHQRPDRGQHIAVHQQNITPGFESAFTIIPSMPAAQMTADYDITSIMHYYSFAFSKNGLATITDGAWNQIPYNMVLSPQDIAIINQMYPLKIDCQKLALERTPYASFGPQPAKDMCTYSLYNFNSLSVEAKRYEWSAPDAIPSTGTDSVFSAYFPKAGKFKVTLKAINEYGSSEKTFSYAIEECIAPSIKALSPSPAIDHLDFTLSSLIPADFNIRVYAMNGQEVVFIKAHTSDLGINTYRLELPVLPLGIYTLVLDVYGTVLSRPFMIAR